MENWIGVGIWIVLGAVIGLSMRVVVKLDQETPGHRVLLMVLGAFSAVIGGMLGVGIFHFWEPLAISAGGMGGAVVLALILTWVYRWGVKGFA
jgi:prepilin signal peptidase PulO-like enzyme (type II secretory pathway)